jgi:hypothetical protein
MAAAAESSVQGWIIYSGKEPKRFTELEMKQNHFNVITLQYCKENVIAFKNKELYTNLDKCLIEARKGFRCHIYKSNYSADVSSFMEMNLRERGFRFSTIQKLRDTEVSIHWDDTDIKTHKDGICAYTCNEAVYECISKPLLYELLSLCEEASTKGLCEINKEFDYQTKLYQCIDKILKQKGFNPNWYWNTKSDHDGPCKIRIGWSSQ